MAAKQFVVLLCLGLMLGSCASSAAFVADHWPHWAGGLPSDTPPRRGAPGYDDFIAHGQPGQNAQATATAAPPAVDERPATTEQATTAQPAPPANHPPNDSTVVQGGLY